MSGAMNFLETRIDQARRALDSDDLNQALQKTTHLFRLLQSPAQVSPLPVGLRDADAILEEIAHRLWNSLPVPPLATSQRLEGDYILATVLYVCGGHTAVIKDITAALPAPPRALWLTMAHPDALGLQREALHRTGLLNITRIFPGYDSLECARQMIDALRESRPQRIFLLHHPDDCVAPVVAAAARKMGTKIVMLHHADANPSSGLFLTGAEIVDFTPRAHFFSHHAMGLPSSWLPLTCPDPGEQQTRFLQRGKLTTALSGSYPKVAAITSPTYPELVTEILVATGGWHLHIGPLPDRVRQRIRARLRYRGIALDRVIHVPLVSSVSAALHEHAVDLVINTYPQGGARLAVEVMAAGVPMAWRSRQPGQDKIQAQMAYPGALVWRTTENLSALLKTIDQAWLERQGKAARARYCQRHHPDIWKTWFAGQNGTPQRLQLQELDHPAVLASLCDYLIEARGASKMTIEGIRNLVRGLRSSLIDTLKWQTWPLLARILQKLAWRSLRWR